MVAAAPRESGALNRGRGAARPYPTTCSVRKYGRAAPCYRGVNPLLQFDPVRHSSLLEKLALGPVSRILFCTLRRFSRHFSQSRLATDLSATARLRGRGGMRHTRDYRAGHPVTYFALHRKGFFMPPSLLMTRWALTPPFHPYLERATFWRVEPGGMFSVTLSVATL